MGCLVSSPYSDYSDYSCCSEYSKINTKTPEDVQREIELKRLEEIELMNKWLNRFYPRWGVARNGRFRCNSCEGEYNFYPDLKILKKMSSEIRMGRIGKHNLLIKSHCHAKHPYRIGELIEY